MFDLGHRSTSRLLFRTLNRNPRFPPIRDTILWPNVFTIIARYMGSRSFSTDESSSLTRLHGPLWVFGKADTTLPAAGAEGVPLTAPKQNRASRVGAKAPARSIPTIWLTPLFLHLGDGQGFKSTPHAGLSQNLSPFRDPSQRKEK